MFQPFEEMKPVFVNKLVELKRYYLVTQTYKRGLEASREATKTHLLITDYSDVGLAKGHFNSLKGDPYAAIIDLTKPEHQSKITEMLSEGSAYILFWAVVRSKAELKQRLYQKYEKNMRRYIAKNTHWSPPAEATVDADLQLIYGELFITLRFGYERRRLTFEELENA